MGQVHSHSHSPAHGEQPHSFQVSSPRIPPAVPPNSTRGDSIFSLSGITAEDWLGGAALVIWIIVVSMLVAGGA